MRSGYNTERRSVNLYLSIESSRVQASGDPITEVKSICRETQRAYCYPWSGERCWSLRWQTDSALLWDCIAQVKLQIIASIGRWAGDPCCSIRNWSEDLTLWL